MRRLGRLPPWELGLLLATAVWAFGPLVAVVIDAARGSRTLTGADGPIAGDQLQYLAWMRDAASHGLAANLFDLSPSSHVFGHPMFTLSGLANGLGVSLTVAYWAWKPVAVIVLVAGALAWARRLVPERPGSQVAAAALALFSFSPLAALWLWLGLGSAGAREDVVNTAGELFSAGELWGYSQTAIAIGLMPVVIGLVDRARRPGARPGAPLAGAAAVAALVSWLHPWQGVVLAVILAGLAAWPGQAARRRALCLLPLGGALLPLAYYGLLARHDTAWDLASRQNEVGIPPLYALVLALAPLAIPAAFGLRSPRQDDDAELALLLWIPTGLAALVVVKAFPPHFLAGLSFPLAVLAVRGAARLRPSALVAGAAIALATLPGMAYVSREFRRVYRSPYQQLYLVSDEAHALDYVRHRAGPGGVLASPAVATAVPSQTGRAVWAGHPSWTPNYYARVDLAGRLFAGRLAPDQARGLVLLSGARLLVADCRGSADLRRLLGPLVRRTHHFGCAAVYEVGPSPRA